MKVHCRQWWWADSTPIGSRGAEREGYITSTWAQALREVQGIFLEANYEGYRDVTWRSGGRVQGHMGKSNVAVTTYRYIIEHVTNRDRV